MSRVIPFCDRGADPSMFTGPVFVYRNLHKATVVGDAVYSLRDVTSGLVVAHAPVVWLRDVQFVVSAAGRDRVRAEGRKNVHAGVRGTVAAPPFGTTSRLRPAYYNPYTVDGFVDRETGEPLRQAAWALIGKAGVGYVPA